MDGFCIQYIVSLDYKYYCVTPVLTLLPLFCHSIPIDQARLPEV